MADILLRVKKKYFDEVLEGTKRHEYWRVTPYWTARLVGRTYGNIIYCKGNYGSEKNPDNIQIFPWYGVLKTKIKHEEFGDELIEVYDVPLVPCESCPCFRCTRPVPADGSGMECLGCNTPAISNCVNVDVSNEFTCGHVGEALKGSAK